MGSQTSGADSFRLQFGHEKVVPEVIVLNSAEPEVDASADEFEWNSTNAASEVGNKPANDQTVVRLPATVSEELKPIVARPAPTTYAVDPSFEVVRPKRSVEPRRSANRLPRRRKADAQLRSKRFSKSHSWTKYWLAAILCAMIFPNPQQVGAWYVEARAGLAEVVPSLAEPEGPPTPSIPESDIAQTVILQTIPLAISADPKEQMHSDFPKVLLLQSVNAKAVERQMRASLSPTNEFDYSILHPSETLLPTPELVQSVAALGSVLSDDTRFLVPLFNRPTLLKNVQAD